MDRARVALLGAGGLAADPEEIGITLHGIRVPRYSAGTVHDFQGARFNTRIEEYQFVTSVLDELPRECVVDVGAGFNPEIHVLPEIVAAMGFLVTALDMNLQSLAMPTADGYIDRVHGDLCRIPAAASSYIAWLCVSVLEHLDPPQQLAALREGRRVLQPDGLALVTVDEMLPEYLNALLASAGFVTGDLQPFQGQPLTPRVAFAVAQKGG